MLSSFQNVAHAKNAEDGIAMIEQAIEEGMGYELKKKSGDLDGDIRSIYQ